MSITSKRKRFIFLLTTWICSQFAGNLLIKKKSDAALFPVTDGGYTLTRPSLEEDGGGACRVTALKLKKCFYYSGKNDLIYNSVP